MFVKIICLNCKEETKNDLREIKRGNGRFCSQSCASTYNTRAYYTKINKPNVVCAHCDKEFYKSTSKIKKSKSGLFFCCREHKDYAQRIGGIKAIQPAHYGTGYRPLAFSIYERKCMRCQYDKHTAAIIVHHKDRDRTNNDISNLEVLCCNCHAIEHWGKELDLVGIEPTTSTLQK